MSLFLWAATVGSPTGYFLFSFVAQHRTWRTTLWAIFGVSAGFWLIMVAVMLYCGETRHSILLPKRAKKERKQGNEKVDVPEEAEQRGATDLFKVVLTRPFRFLFTEAIILFAALYNGYLYGLSFLFNDAFSLVFGPQGHGFNVVSFGLSFLGVAVGISIGPFTNIWQERYYQRKVKETGGNNIPEARVQLGKVVGIGQFSRLVQYLTHGM